MLLIVQVVDIGIVNVPFILGVVPQLILGICHVAAQRVFASGLNLVLLPPGGEIVNLADLLDGVLRIEGMPVVVRIVQDRGDDNVVVRAVRVSVDGIAEGQDTSVIPECFLVRQFAGEGVVSVRPNRRLQHFNGLDMAGIPESLRDVVIAQNLLEVRPARKRDKIQGIRLITGFQGKCADVIGIIAVERQLLIVVCLAGIILYVGDTVERRTWIIGSACIRAESKLAQLGIQIAVPAYGAECACIGSQRTAVARFQAPGHHDIDDAADAFRIVFHRRIGDDLDLLDGRCRNGLDELVEVPGQHPGGTAVHQHLVILAAVQQHLLVTIDAEHRHIPENIDEVAAGRQRVCFHIIGKLVGIGRNQFTAGRDGRFPQMFHFSEGIRLLRHRVLRPGGKAGKQGGCGKNNCLRVHCISGVFTIAKISGKSFTQPRYDAKISVVIWLIFNWDRKIFVP